MAEEPKKKGGLFGGGKPHPESKEPSASFLSQEMSNLSTRLRVLEERSSNIRKKQQIIEQGMLSQRKKFNDEVEVLKEEIDEIKRTMTEIENKIIMLIKELRLTSKKEDTDVLKKYIEMWEPLNFVTHNQVDKVVAEAIEKLKGK